MTSEVLLSFLLVFDSIVWSGSPVALDALHGVVALLGVLRVAHGLVHVVGGHLDIAQRWPDLGAALLTSDSFKSRRKFPRHVVAFPGAVAGPGA